MPDKEGSDDEKKSTKSVVNKKQKQMMGEEGYDIARDMGRVRPSKDKKDATTMPVSKEMRKTQKVNKGPSALERVKAKYGKAVMKVGKKKANEELDLTQVAESFGGYIIEVEIKRDKSGTITGVETTPAEKEAAKKAQEKQREIFKKAAAKRDQKDKLKEREGNQKDIKTAKKMMSGKTDPIVDKEMGALGKTGAKVQKEIETETGRKTRKFTTASGTGFFLTGFTSCGTGSPLFTDEPPFISVCFAFLKVSDALNLGSFNFSALLSLAASLRESDIIRSYDFLDFSLLSALGLSKSCSASTSFNISFCVSLSTGRVPVLMSFI